MHKICVLILLPLTFSLYGMEEEKTLSKTKRKKLARQSLILSSASGEMSIVPQDSPLIESSENPISTANAASVQSPIKPEISKIIYSLDMSVKPSEDQINNKLARLCHLNDKTTLKTEEWGNYDKIFWNNVKEENLIKAASVLNYYLTSLSLTELPNHPYSTAFSNVYEALVEKNNKDQALAQAKINLIVPMFDIFKQQIEALSRNDLENGCYERSKLATTALGMLKVKRTTTNLEYSEVTKNLYQTEAEITLLQEQIKNLQVKVAQQQKLQKEIFNQQKHQERANTTLQRIKKQNHHALTDELEKIVKQQDDQKSTIKLLEAKLSDVELHGKNPKERERLEKTLTEKKEELRKMQNEHKKLSVLEKKINDEPSPYRTFGKLIGW